MTEYVDITMTTTSQWIALGHNGQRFMVKDTTFRYYLTKLVPKNSLTIINIAFVIASSGEVLVYLVM